MGCPQHRGGSTGTELGWALEHPSWGCPLWPVCNPLLPAAECPAEMASDPGAEPDAEDAAEAEEGVYEEVMPCDRMELSQRLAVEELITTEASYVHNIQLCVLDIRAHLQKKQVRQDTSPYPGAGDRSMNLLRAARCPKHCREVATCSPSTSLVSFSQLEVLGWVDIGSDPVQLSYGFNPSSVT